MKSFIPQLLLRLCGCKFGGYGPATNVAICFVRTNEAGKTDIDAYNIQTLLECRR